MDHELLQHQHVLWEESVVRRMHAMSQDVMSQSDWIFLNCFPKPDPNFNCFKDTGCDDGGHHLHQEVEVHTEHQVLQIDVQVVDDKSIFSELEVVEIRFEDQSEGWNEFVDVVEVFMKMTGCQATEGRGGRGQ
jgi:hypothetical protein